MKNNTANIYTIYKRDAKQIFIGGYQGESYNTHKLNIVTRICWYVRQLTNIVLQIIHLYGK